MTTKRVTQLLLLVTAAVWIAWDIYAVGTKPTGDTESEVIRLAANRHPFVPFGFGVLMSHFFLNAMTKAQGWRSPWNLLAWQARRHVTVIGLPAVGMVALGLDLFGIVPWIHPAVPFVIGVVVGRILWAQRVKV